MSWLSKVVSTVEHEITEVEAWIKGVDWAAVIEYYTKFVSGLETAVEPVVEVLFPGSKSTIAQVVNPLLTQATSAVAALTTAAEAYKAGTLSTSDLTATAHTVQAAVVAANAVVGAAISGIKATAPAQPPAAQAS